MSLFEFVHRLAGDFLEQLAEVLGVGVADFRAHFADCDGRIREQLFRILDPHDGLVIYKAHPCLLLEEFAQIGGAEVHVPCHLLKAYVACEIVFYDSLGVFDDIRVVDGVLVMVEVVDAPEQFFYIVLKIGAETYLPDPVIRMPARYHALLVDERQLYVKYRDDGLYELPEKFHYQGRFVVWCRRSLQRV